MSWNIDYRRVLSSAFIQSRRKIFSHFALCLHSLSETNLRDLESVNDAVNTEFEYLKSLNNLEMRKFNMINIVNRIQT